MADIYYSFTGLHQRRGARIDKVIRAVESTCRRYDQGITTCVWLLVALIVWFVVAGTVQVDAIKFYENASATVCSPVERGPRHETRRLHRVIRTMYSSCDTGQYDAIVGPQIHVNGKPFLKRVFTICKPNATHTDFINPIVAVTGSTQGVCIDEIDGLQKQKTRLYPITLHSDNSAPYTAMELTEVCIILQSLDLLNGIW